MESSLDRKDHDPSHFIDHTLLDSELMGLARADWDFPKSVVGGGVGDGGTDPEHNSYEPVKHTLPTNLTFHNEYFQFVNKHVVPGQMHHQMDHAPGPPVGPAGTSVVITQTRSYEAVKHAESEAAVVAADDFLNLNTSFLNDATHDHVGHGNTPVATFPAHAIEPTVPMHDQSTLHEEDLLYGPNTRKALPHKKRISRKLRGTLGDLEPAVDAPNSTNLGNDIDTTVPYAHLVVGNHKRHIYTCEICGYAASAQIDFFAHLKQHYEPTHGPSGSTLMQGDRSLNEVQKDCNSLANVMHTKSEHTQRDDEQAKLDQVLRAVELDFDHFQQQHHHHHQHQQQQQQAQHHHHHPVTHDVSVVLAQSHDAMAHLENHPTITSNPPVDNDNPNAHACFVTTTDDLSLNNVNVVSNSGVVDDVEFSDTEDMLEGIRNVVDKVSFEDTCDELDLITSNALRTNWFTNNNFSDINYRNCDETFSGQLSQLLLVGEPQPQQQQQQQHAPPTQVPPPLSSSTTTTVTTSNIVQTSVLPIKPNTPPPPTLLSLPVTSNEQLPFLVNNDAILTDALPPNEADDMQVEQQLNKQIESTKLLSPLVLSQSNDAMQSPPLYNEALMPTTSSALTTTIMHDTPPPPQSLPTTPVPEQNVNHSASSDSDNELLIPMATPSAVTKKISPRQTKLKVRMPTKIVDHERKTYTCTKCEREFNSKNALKYHNRTHTQERPYKCDECGNSFFAIGALKTHLLTHTGEKPFECSTCQRKFGRFGDLKYHLESIHNDVKSHMCEYCGKSFSRKYSLVLHRRIHTSERNFSCDYCSKSFRASCYLKSHMKIHTGEKPFPCEVCKKAFRVLGDMRRHMRIHDRPDETATESRSPKARRKKAAAKGEPSERIAKVE